MMTFLWYHKGGEEGKRGRRRGGQEEGEREERNPLTPSQVIYATCIWVPD